MGNKSHGLKHGWTFIAHKSYKIYSNANAYVVIDYENDVVLQFTVTDADLEIVTANWGLNFKIILGFKTIKILDIPEE